MAPVDDATNEWSDTIREREALGLTVDVDVLRRALEETDARTLAGAPEIAGTLLTDEESAAFGDRQAMDFLLDEVRANIQDAYDHVVSVGLSHDIMRPEVILLSSDASAEPAETLAVIESALPGIPASVEIVAVSRQTADRLQAALSAEDQLEDSPLYSSLAAATVSGLVPLIGVSHEGLGVTLVVGDEADLEVGADLERLVNEFAERHTGDSVPIALEVGQVVESMDRDSNPGQVAGGVRISHGGTCTSGFAVRRNGVPALASAGHCAGVGTTVSHLQQGLGSVVLCRNTSTPVPNCPAGGPGTDASVIGMTRPNLISEYALINPPGSGPVYRLGMTSHATSNTTIPSSWWVCLQGASPHRITHWGSFDESCGWGTGSATTSYGRADVTSCMGDSGGLIRHGQQIVGVLHGQGGADVAPSCRSIVYVTMAQRFIAEFGVTILTADVLSTPSNPRPTTRAAVRAANGLCVSAENSSYANGTRYLQWACYAGHQAQSFGLVPVGPPRDADTFLLVRWDGTNRSCLSVDTSSAGGGTGNGALVHSWQCYGGSNVAQLWRVEWNPSTGSGDGTGGWIRLRSLSANRCLSVPNGSSQQGIQLHLWDCYNGNSGQQWALS